MSFVIHTIKPNLSSSLQQIADSTSFEISSGTITDDTDNIIVLRIDLAQTYVNKTLDGKNQAIQLLKWLRIRGVYNHCLVKSDDPLIDILNEDPKNAIVASIGTTFVYFPQEELEPRNFESASETQLKEIFRLDIDLKVIRHDAANKFGLLRLRESHHFIEPTTVFSDVSSDDELLHEIIRYVFAATRGFVPRTNAISTVTRRLERLRSEHSKVIYVDDKAHEGWANFLKVILGANCDFTTIVPDKNENEDSLARKVANAKIDVRDKHLVIFDLKLLDSESEITNYQRLLSYRTVQKLRDRYQNRLRIMYLTASNDLSKFRKLLLSKKYNPHVVFTKEGADQFLSAEESFLHYCELTELFAAFLAVDEPRKIVESIEIVNLLEEAEKKELAEVYSKICSEVSFSRDFGAFDEFDEIFPDTNIFLHSNPKELVELMVAQKDRFRILETVRYELMNLSRDSQGKKPLEGIRAAFFVHCIEELEIKIDNTGIFPNEQRIIVQNGQPPDGFADDHFQRLMKTKHKNVLALSNDRQVFNVCINVTGKKSIEDVLRTSQSKPVSGAIRSSTTILPPLPPTEFRVGAVSISADGQNWILADRMGSRVKLSFKKVDFPGLDYNEIKKRSHGKIIRTDSSSDEIKTMIMRD